MFSNKEFVSRNFKQCYGGGGQNQETKGHSDVTSKPSWSQDTLISELAEFHRKVGNPYSRWKRKILPLKTVIGISRLWVRSTRTCLKELYEKDVDKINLILCMALKGLYCLSIRHLSHTLLPRSLQAWIEQKIKETEY